MRDQQVATQRDTPSRAEAAEVAPPGKHTRTMALPAAAVQRSAETTAAPADVHGIAAAGVAGTGGPLPHLGPLQRLFGPAHDLSRVQAFVGGGAADAAAGIGARAYATGDRVAFASAPDLHTAAHEAAHVVQQQRGVQLAGGVGAAGDAYERHADAVADRVVRGESAAELLADGAGGGGATTAIQRQEAPKDGAKDGAKGGAGGASGGAAAPSAIRAAAKAWLASVPKTDLYSDTNHEAFIKYTGTSHETMKKNWDNGGIMTACNGFTGTYSSAIGLGYLGAFTLASLCAGAFVRPGGGRFPKYGDIVKMSGLHVCVSLDCGGEGGTWDVIEAGQGGKSAGHDILRHNTKKFSGGDVEGWVDIDQWTDPAVRARVGTAAQLTGVWEVKAGARTWNYTFTSANNTVTWIDADNPASAGAGTWEQDGAGPNVVFFWDSGAKETWPVSQATAGHGAGVSDTAGAVSFAKLDLNPKNLRNELLGDKRYKVTRASDTWNYTFTGDDAVSWVDAADAKQTGKGHWTARDRAITIRWDSGTVEHWDLPKTHKPFTSTLSVGDPCTVTPRW